MSGVILFEPITCLFPKGGSPVPDDIVDVPNCILCQRPTHDLPSRMGVIATSERTAAFCVCGSCADCSDTELEAKVIRKVSAPPPRLAAE
jgi:hypothetical protein